ncbi:MAG: PilZ domain-containing protein [Pseudomonadota bacterium]
MTDGLWCECDAPFAWQADTRDAGARLRGLSEATLLLTALNQMESMPEPLHATHAEAGGAEGRRLERVEAKLDLALHLLARAIEPGPLPDSRVTRISPQGVSWPDVAPPAAGTRLLLELHPSPSLPLALRLPALAQPPAHGMAHAVFIDLPEGLLDALHQFVFRRHRQAIRDRTLGKTY